MIIQGNNVDILKTISDNTFDSIVTDPPYGIAFLGKDWDNNTGALETWQECFRVLKPGGHLLAFSAARTYHHLATNIEMAGFEIRDQLMWLYGSGFPKAQDIGKAIDKREGKKDETYLGTTGNETIAFTEDNKGGSSRRCSKCGKHPYLQSNCETPDDCGLIYEAQSDLGQQWLGWKTSLKPAHEPVVMARKTFSGSTVDNVLEHGVGALNIDASRIPYNNEQPVTTHSKKAYKGQSMAGEFGALETHSAPGQEQGRFPSNVIMDEEAGAMLDAQAPKTGNGHRAKTKVTGYGNFGGGSSSYEGAGEKLDGLSGASKFFYCPKVSREERHTGFEQMPEPVFGDVKGCYDDGKRFAAKHQELQANKRPRGEAFGDGNVLKDATETSGNNHPTVKPVELMKYLVRLVTPKNGKVLDPFNGSGSTGLACEELGCDYTGIELDPDYVEISNKRISAWKQKYNTHLFEY